MPAVGVETIFGRSLKLDVLVTQASGRTAEMTAPAPKRVLETHA
ncbi:hypothetical protein MP213Fo_13280 [Pseudochrobactrum sp. MP213Fo]